MGQIYNPYLPLWEYVPDGEPHVFENRLYIYGSHDKEGGSQFCELDYVCYSAPVGNLTEWRYEGIIYEKRQDPENRNGGLCLYAPDVCQGPDGRYYLYYCLQFSDSISVAVCDTPAGKYQYYGRVSYPDGRLLTENLPYDPSVMFEDGHVYLYYGFAPTTLRISKYQNREKLGCSAVELEADMRTVKTGPCIVIPSADYEVGTTFQGHGYFEAPSVRRIGAWYYLVYSSVHAHELCYAVSKKPMEGFRFGGVIVSNGDIGYLGRRSEERLMAIGNNHGGLAEVNDQWYIFYHRHTHGNAYNRQGCAEPVVIGEDGSIAQVTITTSGLNGGPLEGKGEYPAVICCNLTDGHMPMMPAENRGNQARNFPQITNRGEERYLTGIADGTLIGYKYFDLRKTREIRIRYRGNCCGELLVYASLEKIKLVGKC